MSHTIIIISCLFFVGGISELNYLHISPALVYGVFDKYAFRIESVAECKNLAGFVAFGFVVSGQYVVGC